MAKSTDDEIRARRVLAADLLTRYDALWCKNWPTRIAETKLANYANGGYAPDIDPQALCDQDPLPVPLGYAARWFKDILTPIQNAIRLQPGPIQLTLKYPAIPNRALYVTEKTNEIINRETRQTIQRTLDIAAGRMLLTGKACLFRTSAKETFMQNGRVLTPDIYPDDPKDSAFREWGFMADIKLRQVDEILRSLEKDGGDAGTRDDPKGPISKGWQKEGLRMLKKWILSNDRERLPSSDDAWPMLLMQPFPYSQLDTPQSVYWVFRKTGRYNEKGPHMGDEMVDLYCISRFGCASGVSTIRAGDNQYSAMQVVNKYDKSSEGADDRLLYYLPDAFASVDECMALIVDDQRIDGEQYIGDVRGSGQVALPRLQVMESLIYDATEGLRTALIPLWTKNGEIDEQFRRMIEKQGGFAAHQFVPNNITPLARNNSLPPINQAMAISALLERSTGQDAQRETQRSRDEFASENNLQVEQLKAQTGLRVTRFNDGVLPYYCGIKDSLLRPLDKARFRKSDPCYLESQRIYSALEHCRIHPDEVTAGRWTVVARTLPGGLEKQESIRASLAMANQCAALYPQGVQFFLRNAAVAMLGETIAAEVFPVEQKPKQDPQQAIAYQQSAMSLATHVPAPRNPSDNPALHVQVHIPILQQQMKPLLQSGQATQAQAAGIAALIAHTVLDARAMPQKAAAPIGKMLMQAAQAMSKMQITDGRPQMDPAKAEALRIQAEREQRLAQNDKTNAQFKQAGQQAKEADIMLRARQTLDQEKTAELNRAKGYLDIAHQAAEGPPPIEREVTERELAIAEQPRTTDA